jgi:hypothetical protein
MGECVAPLQTLARNMLAQVIRLVEHGTRF